MTRAPRRARRLVVVVVSGLVALLGAQCQPPKPPSPLPPPPGALLTYYVTYEPASLTVFRSPAPHARPVGASGTSAQALLPDGSVALDITGLAPGDGSIGSSFQTRSFRFGDFLALNIDLTAGSDESIVTLLFDVDGDGDFFEWTPAGDYIGNGDDLSAQCLDGVALTGAIDDSTSCVLIDANGAIGTFTVGELMAGAHPGIGASTSAAIAVLLPVDSARSNEAHAVVRSLVLNGFDLLVP